MAAGAAGRAVTRPGYARLDRLTISPQVANLPHRRTGDKIVQTTKREEFLRVAAGRGARNVRVFGPVARGDNDGRSDIDFPVDLEPGRSLFDLSGLAIDLEAVLRAEVDAVTGRGLRSRVRERVLREAAPLGGLCRAVSGLGNVGN